MEDFKAVPYLALALSRCLSLYLSVFPSHVQDTSEEHELSSASITPKYNFMSQMVAEMMDVVVSDGESKSMLVALDSD